MSHRRRASPRSDESPRPLREKTMEHMGQPRFARGEDNGNGHAQPGTNGNGIHAAEVAAPPAKRDGAGEGTPRGLADSPSGVGPSAEGAAASRDHSVAPAPDPALRDRLGRFKPGNCGGPG